MVEAKVSLLSLLEREYLGRPGQWQVNRSDMEAAPSVESLVPISHKNLAMEVRPLVLALLVPWVSKETGPDGLCTSPNVYMTH